ncbi:hypothetical protein NDN01_15365 [Sphingomonas sp. QA11]|uniref:hypothetical protein n=1 Tax=Sphingomonas sp. QA11 TaxID=2950605 RepID=UPI002348F75A|nr:hypothetical protein [Sphingomonas sp. QA11]WCM25435.1 hypothetical protein NDN01_15365 [Sphingomonas sp. QA11]
MRLFVTGPTGSGKTTFAARVAREAALPLYSLDDLHWIRHPDGDRRRAPEERLALLRPLARQTRWVIEGVQFKWADAALDNADKIVVLDLPRWRNTLRIVRRFLSRGRFSSHDPRATWAALGQEMRWSKDYYDHERALLFEKLGRHEEKVVKVRDDHVLRETLEDIISTTAIERDVRA